MCNERRSYYVKNIVYRFNVNIVQRQLFLTVILKFPVLQLGRVFNQLFSDILTKS